MKTFSAPVWEDNLLFDLLEEINSHCEDCATTLVMLGHDPDNRDLLDKLFRSVHSVKGDIGITQIDPLLPLLTAVEDILGMMREGLLRYDSLISDLLLTILETVKSFIDDCAHYGCTQYDQEVFASSTETISKIKLNNIVEHEALLTKSLLILDPSLAISEEESDTDEDELDQVRLDWTGEAEADLIFFHNMMKPIEQRLDHWEGRSSRQLKLALLLNQFGGSPVDVQQLTTAVYLHDIGMTLVPLALLRQETPLLKSEILRLQNHVQRGVSFLSEMPHWAEAQRFIHEHHERPDGQGYPAGLNNDEISHGAKILALVDAFEAMTHDRAHQTHRKRPIAHTVKEINLTSGSQFCPYWVSVFNDVMASIFSK